MPDTPADANGARSGFTGRPSVQARIGASTFGLLRSITGLIGVDLGTSVNALMASRRPPRHTTRAVVVLYREFNGWELCTLRSDSPSGKHVVAIHGGAFVCEATVLHWRDYVAIARQTAATVVVPVYPLAPNGTASTVVPQMADLITWMIGEHGPDNVSIYGDSAGGSIALCAAQELVRRKAATPARMVLLSPLLDATLSNPDIGFVNDPVLNVEVLKMNFALWAADLDLADPLLSPLYGSLGGLPTTAVYAGSLEVLGPDAIALQAKSLATPGADFTFDLRNGEMHDWAMTSWLPEARAVRSQIYHQLLGS
ncbi:alpha/beta hydrolase [Mycobacterium montefiorense]|uniref:alpha/beta hydrolase n=1 Tax=Mycobacterium montefiorense TaxID=154654 RepID=UPI0021F3AEBE|nr:alpha/beta hydrolase [Mycobacterium montefiorense]MCV7426368.1 alpha/beta hydrolase fold domain-containing protein [Mycobacterium montefiorense]